MYYFFKELVSELAKSSYCAGFLESLSGSRSSIETIAIVTVMIANPKIKIGDLVHSLIYVRVPRRRLTRDDRLKLSIFSVSNLFVMFVKNIV